MSCHVAMLSVMGKTSRDKGARGELEVVSLAAQCGIEAQRTASLQAGRVPGHPDVSLLRIPGYHIEVKRDERMSVDAMVRQAYADKDPAATPLVAWRRNQQGINKGIPWMGAIPLAHVFELLSTPRFQGAVNL